MKRSIGPILAAILLCFLTGCNTPLITGFKLGIAATKPFVQSLVTSGAITQEKADLVVGDITEGISDASVAESCIKSITVTGGAKRVEQAKCYFALGQSLRGVLARNNLEGNQKITDIANIIGAAIESFEAYYTSVTSGPVSAASSTGITNTGADGIAGANADKELEGSLKRLNEQLKTVVKTE